MAPGRNYLQDFSYAYFNHNLQRSVWRLEFAWLPKTCARSGKRIWFELAYKGTNMITGPGDPEIEIFWLSKNEYLIWRITDGAN